MENPAPKTFYLKVWQYLRGLIGKLLRYETAKTFLKSFIGFLNNCQKEVRSNKLESRGSSEYIDKKVLHLVEE